MALQGMTPDEKRDKVLGLAHWEGLKAGAISAAVSCSAVYYYQRKSAWFAKSTNGTIRTALALSPFFLAYHFKTEMVMGLAMRDPNSYGIFAEGSEHMKNMKAQEKIKSRLKLHQRAANWLYEHPFEMLGIISVPAVGGILWSTKDKTHMKLSQKLMHTRVYGQMAVLTTLFSLMSFREYMKRHGGKFVEEAEDAENEEKREKKDGKEGKRKEKSTVATVAASKSAGS